MEAISIAAGIIGGLASLFGGGEPPTGGEPTATDGSQVRWDMRLVRRA